MLSAFLSTEVWSWQGFFSMGSVVHHFGLLKEDSNILHFLLNLVGWDLGEAKMHFVKYSLRKGDLRRHRSFRLLVALSCSSKTFLLITELLFRGFLALSAS